MLPPIACTTHASIYLHIVFTNTRIKDTSNYCVSFISVLDTKNFEKTLQRKNWNCIYSRIF